MAAYWLFFYVICLLVAKLEVASHMYITVPNPFTDTGRGCRVYYFLGNEPLTLREVPWECSAVYHEAFFWKGNNVTEITYAKIQDTLPLPSWLLPFCGDSKSIRTYAIHHLIAVCLVVNHEGGVDIAWASTGNYTDSGRKKPFTKGSVRGMTKMYWPGRSLSKKIDKIFLGAVFDGNSLQILAISQHNNNLMHAEVYVEDIVLLGNTSLPRFAFQQVVVEVPRLAPDTYHAWITGPGKYRHVHGYSREGSIYVNAGSDLPRKEKYPPDQKDVRLENENICKNSDGKDTCVPTKDLENASEEIEGSKKKDDSVDVAFGSGSGGYEPDEDAKSINRMRDRLDTALELFQKNDFLAAKAIYQNILDTVSSISPANAQNIQAARFNLASVYYRLGEYVFSAQYLEDLIRDHARVVSMLADGRKDRIFQKTKGEQKESSDTRFQYIPLAYNLLGDVLFYRDADVERGLGIFSHAKQIHLSDPSMQNHIFSILVKWSKHWHAKASKELNSFEAVSAAGLLMFEIGAVVDAKKVLERARDLRPKHKSALVNYDLGMIYIQSKEYEKAGRYLARFTQIDKKKYEGWLWRGRNAKYAKKFKSALRYFDRAIKLDPNKREAYSESINMLKYDEGRLVPNGIKLAHKYAEKAISMGILKYYEQTPRHFVSGLASSPWHNPEDMAKQGSQAIKVLQENFEIIQKEVMAAFENGLLVSEGVVDKEGLTVSGKWTELNLYHLGRKFEKNCNILPVTTSIIEQLPEIVSHVKGATKISVLQPGTEIRPHHGPTNTRIRLHMGLKVSKEAFITVGNVTRTWEEGKILAFDDSFTHSVVNGGDEPRVALISDVWPPSMTDSEILNSLETNEEVERYRYRVNLFNDKAGQRTNNVVPKTPIV